jgi:hypothetical protein
MNEPAHGSDAFYMEDVPLLEFYVTVVDPSTTEPRARRGEPVPEAESEQDAADDGKDE